MLNIIFDNYGVVMMCENFQKFSIGCNYWASNAGVYMWRRWDEQVVEADFKRLSEMGIDCLRVFPLWEDFQPLTRHIGNVREEMRLCDLTLDRSPEGMAGVDPVMIARFEKMIQLAQKYGLKLLVCIINGWMSGKLFCPPAFYNLNLITNRTAVKWTVRFVKYFVSRFKNYDNIIAWEPGNETNVMCRMGVSRIDKAECDPDEYWVWLSGIVNAIKSEDNSRPVIAGMHGLEMDGEISPVDVGEICDMMTVHPYPAFVPHCFTDSLTSMKSRLHSTAEGTLYSDIGGKKCLCEEIGTLGNMLASNKKGADYLRVNAHSLWANGSTGLMWWCAFDQDFTFAPYDWNGLERELGLMRMNGTFKETADEIKKIRDFVDGVGPLPERKRDAVCVLTKHQDKWAVAFSSLILSKQAGIEIQFADGDYDIPESRVYMLPSVCGDAAANRTMKELLNRVYDKGAALYISWNDAYISSLQEITGINILGNRELNAVSNVFIEEISQNLPIFTQRELEIEPDGSDVLATDQNGKPMLLARNYGKGRIYFLKTAPELQLIDVPNAFDCTDSKKYYKLYEYILKPHINRSVISKSSPFVGVTEHPLNDGKEVIVAVNYIDEPIECRLGIGDKKVAKVRFGKVQDQNGAVNVSLSGGGICVFEVED